MSLCAECERAGAAHPVREPVLVGDVLAGLAAVVPLPRACPGGPVPDTERAVSAVPQQRTPSTAARGTPAVCDRCGADAAWHRTA